MESTRNFPRLPLATPTVAACPEAVFGGAIVLALEVVVSDFNIFVGAVRIPGVSLAHVARQVAYVAVGMIAGITHRRTDIALG